jgi:hypothetical protein
MQNQAYKFYTSLIGKVEIDREGVLETAYFQIPALTVYVPSQTKNRMIMDVNRNSHEEKIKSFFINSEKYIVEMRHLQNISRFRALASIASKWETLDFFNYCIIVLLNFLLLISINEKDPKEDLRVGDFEGEGLLVFFGVIILILAIVVYLSRFWE